MDDLLEEIESDSHGSYIYYILPCKLGALPLPHFSNSKNLSTLVINECLAVELTYLGRLGVVEGIANY